VPPLHRARTALARLLLTAALLVSSSAVCQEPEAPAFTAEQIRELDRADALRTLALDHREAVRYDAAIAGFGESLDIYRRYLGSDHHVVASSLNDLAVTLLYQGDYAGAKPLMEECLAIYRRILGSDHTRVATVLNNLGSVFKELGDPAAARPLLEECLAIERRILGEDHPEVAVTMNNLGALLQDLGDVEGATELYEESVALSRRQLDPDDPELAAVLGNLASLLWDQQDFDASLRVAEESLAIYRRAHSADHPNIAKAMMMVAGALKGQGQYRRARRLLEDGMSMIQRTLGDDHPDVTWFRNSLGSLLRVQGDYVGARRQFERSLEATRASMGPEHPEVAVRMGNLALVLRKEGDLDRARELFEESLAMQRRRLGPGHPELGVTQSNLADVLQTQGEYDAARLLYEESLGIAQTVGPGHPATIIPLHNLAALLHAQGDLDGAQRRYEESLDVARRALGDEHPLVAFTLTTLGRVRIAKGDVGVARGLLAESLAIYDARADLLDGLSEREAMLYLKDSTRAFRYWLKAFSRPGDEAEAWSNVNRWKGAATQRLRSRARSAQASSDPAVQGTLDELEATRRSLAARVFSQSVDDDEQRRVQILELTDRKEVLERELADALSRMGFVGVETTTATQLCAGLPDDTVLVDFYRSSSHYLAFVVRSDCSVSRVHLPEADALDRAISHWRTGLARGVAKPETAARAGMAGRVVGDAIWPLLAPHLEGARALWLVPDGALGALPWPALPTDNGLLIDTFELQVLSHANDLAAPVSPPGDGLLTVSGVDYGSGDVAGPCQEQTWASLASTTVESDEIVRLWKRKRRKESVLSLRGSGAAEGAFRAQASGRRVLHVATHGFFSTEECVASGDAAGLNPMLLSGLVLAGANDVHDPLAPEDGYLTAEEVGGLDLRGTELVVLSACETGLGEIRVGEGVMGLQRAFSLAGAETVVMSLWPVPDQPTASLMVELVRNTLNGRSAATALRTAQLSMRRRGEPTGSWAAWLVSGRGQVGAQPR